MTEWVKVFAPATVANVGPGFDILGFALEGLGDIVEARIIPEKKVVISLINNNKLPKIAEKNTAGIAALEVLKLLNIQQGIEIKLNKGLPPGSGMGGSGASAVAGAYATNLLFGNKLSKNQLIEPCLKAEIAVSGYHADNVAPSLLGGFVLIKGYKPLEIIHLGGVDNLFCVIASPNIKVETRLAREAVPKQISIESHIYNSGHSAAIVAGVLKNHIKIIGNSINDIIVEPARAHLIPGFYDVKNAALNAGALGCSISGAGPSVFAIIDNQAMLKEIGNAMKQAFEKHGLRAKIFLSKINNEGAENVL